MLGFLQRLIVRWSAADEMYMSDDDENYGRLFCVASAYTVVRLIQEKTHALLSFMAGSIVGAARGSRGSFEDGVVSIALRILVNINPTLAATQVTYISC